MPALAGGRLAHPRGVQHHNLLLCLHFQHIGLLTLALDSRSRRSRWRLVAAAAAAPAAPRPPPCRCFRLLRLRLLGAIQADDLGITL